MIQEWIEQSTDSIFIAVVLFSLIHPIIDSPWSFLTMSLSLRTFGVIPGFSILILTNIVGIIIVYGIMCFTKTKTNNFFQKKKVSKKILDWLETTPLYKHIIVIGLPLVPTWPIKISLPLSGISFKKYVITITLSYVFLYSCYSFVYFGIVHFSGNQILGSILLILFALIVYFGRSITKKLFIKGD